MDTIVLGSWTNDAFLNHNLKLLLMAKKTNKGKRPKRLLWSSVSLEVNKDWLT